MAASGFEIWSRLQKKPAKAPAEPKPLNQVGKVGKQRQEDRKAKLKAEPADHTGRRRCYVCLKLTSEPVLEHIVDGSVRPDLRHNKLNQRWADFDCNNRKKLGTLTEAEQERVDLAVAEVLDKLK